LYSPRCSHAPPLPRAPGFCGVFFFFTFLEGPAPLYSSSGPPSTSPLTPSGGPALRSPRRQGTASIGLASIPPSHEGRGRGEVTQQSPHATPCLCVHMCSCVCWRACVWACVLSFVYFSVFWPRTRSLGFLNPPPKGGFEESPNLTRTQPKIVVGDIFFFCKTNNHR